MARGVIHLEWIGEHIAQLRLDNPEARNAMSHTMMLHLEEHCREIIGRARIVILCSTGTKSFCASCLTLILFLTAGQRSDDHKEINS